MFKDKPVYIRDGAIALAVLVLISAVYFIFHKSAPADSSNATKLQVVPTNKDIQDAYSADSDAVFVRTDFLFSAPLSADPQLLIPTRSTAIESRIETLRAELNQTLADWQNISRTLPSNDIADPNIVARARSYADAVSGYIDELRDVVSGLTPVNSGLTQAEIDKARAEVDAAVDEAGKAGTSLGGNGAGNSGGTTGQDNGGSTSTGTSDGNTGSNTPPDYSDGSSGQTTPV